MTSLLMVILDSYKMTSSTVSKQTFLSTSLTGLYMIFLSKNACSTRGNPMEEDLTAFLPPLLHRCVPPQAGRNFTLTTVFLSGLIITIRPRAGTRLRASLRKRLMLRRLLRKILDMLRPRIHQLKRPLGLFLVAISLVTSMLTGGSFRKVRRC